MPILEILVYPDPRLRKIAAPVTAVDEGIRQLVEDLTQTMYEANGIGLAATQVDRHLQVIVMDTSESRDQRLVLINPKIIERDGEQIYDEGGAYRCLNITHRSVVLNISKFRHSMRRAKFLKCRLKACWQCVFSMRWIICWARFLLITCLA